MREFMRRVPIKARNREKDPVRDILQKWPKLIAWLEGK